MAEFPSGVYSPRTKANKNGVVYDASKQTIGYAEDVTKLDDEVVAVETELGTTPSGAYATVKAWLTALTSLLNTHKTRHQNGGADEISVAGLSGELADDQPAKAHKSSHASGGGDALSDADIETQHAVEFIIDGGGSAITTGQKGHYRIPFKCEILSVTLLADQSGSIKIDLWKDTYANYPPTNADTICGSNEPEISSGTKDEDTTLTSWTKSIAAGDVLAFNVDSVATVERVTVILKIKKVV